MVVISQIVLAGVIAPLSGLLAPVARGLVGCYRGQQALQRLLPATDRGVLAVSDGDLA